MYVISHRLNVIGKKAFDVHSMEKATNVIYNESRDFHTLHYVNVIKNINVIITAFTFAVQPLM